MASIKLNCASGVNVARSGSIEAWANPGNITGGSTYPTYAQLAYDSNDDNSYTDWLRATNFGFDSYIGENDTIDGVKMTYRHWTSAPDQSYEHALYLAYNGSAIGSNKARGAGTTYPQAAAGGSDAYFTTWATGGSTDLWGVTLTPAIVRSSSFGIFMSVGTKSTKSTNDHLVAWVKLEVFYTPGYGNTVFAKPGASIGKVFAVPATNISKVFGV